MWFHETVPLHILHAGLTTTIRRRDWAWRSHRLDRAFSRSDPADL
jgi:hypothetical protein